MNDRCDVERRSRRRAALLPLAAALLFAGASADNLTSATATAEALRVAQSRAYQSYMEAARVQMGSRRFDRYRSRGMPILLALRRSSHANHSYPDRFIFLRDGRAMEMPGATQPSVTGRGISMIKAGVYIGVPNGPHDGAPSWWIKTVSGSGSLPDRRDKDGDGRYKGKGESYNSKATEILLHIGRSSTGCLNYRPSDTRRVVHAIGGKGRAFVMVLVRS